MGNEQRNRKTGDRLETSKLLLTAKPTGSFFFKMAADPAGQVNSGDSELDQKIAEWLSLDQVKICFLIFYFLGIRVSAAAPAAQILAGSATREN